MFLRTFQVQALMKLFPGMNKINKDFNMEEYFKENIFRKHFIGLHLCTPDISGYYSNYFHFKGCYNKDTAKPFEENR